MVEGERSSFSQTEKDSLSSACIFFSPFLSALGVDCGVWAE